jgi:hypothetical protein
VDQSVFSVELQSLIGALDGENRQFQSVAQYLHENEGGQPVAPVFIC